MAVTLEQLFDMVDEARDELIALTQELVRIPTVNTGHNHEPPWSAAQKPGEFAEPIVPYILEGDKPTGDELPAAELIRDKLAADGIEATVWKSQANRGNVTAQLGSGSSPSLLYMSHIDVVPVEDESQWTYPPFGAEIHDGRIWGRGAADMKGTVAAETMAMILLKRAGVEFNGTLKLAVCADEESGGAYGFGWLAQHFPETITADYAINEGGGAPIKTGDRLIYPINTGEKGRLEARIYITGRGFHASQPWKADNAIYKAEEVIRRIRNYEPEVSTAHPLFKHLDTLAGIEEPVTDENIDRIIEELWEERESLASFLRAASRMTLVASMINGGVKSNSVAENCLITCDVRSLPHQDANYVQREIERIVEGIDGVRVTVSETSPPSASPYDHPYADYVMAATRKVMARTVGRDDIEFVPGLTVGFTDSSFVRPLGNIAYGFTPGHPDADPSKSGAHNINESADIESIVTICRFMVALAYETVVANGQ
ncbi:MAG TPA: M20/M25/M40 family metallo-hydrolase [Thermomicrobiales bacterium]|nr:M20/M25/M40 family metallo-hydrolase [Thermomicrobiales bacterium]